MFEACTVLGALALVTTSARLFALVSPVTLRTPGLLAKAVTTLEVLSGGRAVLGVGAGWDAAEHEAYGIPFAGTGVRMDQMDEALAVYAKAGADGIAIVGPDDPGLIPAIGTVLGEAFPD
jgi:alkanesulfonate monooxygenase SsuD/methylene tetrahydromethanopterin reductase-like flavin-dependent oxidoreductase (luciferase family)